MKLKPWDRVTDALRPLNSSERKALEESIAEDGILEPIKALPDGRIIDGHNRYAIAGDTARVEVIDRDDDDAFRLAMRLNVARRHMTAAERREAIKATIRDEPETSNVEVAEHFGVAPNTVDNLRSQNCDLETDSEPMQANGNASDRDHYVTRDGTVKSMPKRSTPEDRAQARAMRAQGMPTLDIAQALGFSESAVASWLAQSEAKPKPRGRSQVAQYDASANSAHAMTVALRALDPRAAAEEVADSDRIASWLDSLTELRRELARHISTFQKGATYVGDAR